MIGANSSLQSAFGNVAVDADIGRQGDEMVQRVQELADGRALRRNVILHFGTNSPISGDTVRAILDRLAITDRVVVVNVSAPRRWQDGNNEALAAVVPQYPNAILVDWHGAVLNDPGLVVKDGVHPTTAGIAAYVGLIEQGFADLQTRLDAAAAAEEEQATDPAGLTESESETPLLQD